MFGRLILRGEPFIGGLGIGAPAIGSGLQPGLPPLPVGPQPEVTTLAFDGATYLRHIAYTSDDSDYTVEYPDNEIVTLASGAVQNKTLPSAQSGDVIFRTQPGVHLVDLDEMKGDWSFDTSALPRSLEKFEITTDSAVTGDVADLPRTLSRLYVAGANTVGGNCIDLPRPLTYLVLFGNTTLSGDIGDLPPSLATTYLYGSNTVSGDIANVPSTMSHLRIAGINTVSGDIADTPAIMLYLYLLGLNTVGGDLANMPCQPISLNINGNSTISATTASWRSAMRFVVINAAGMSTPSVDAVLITLDRDVVNWSSEKMINISGNNSPPSAVSAMAITSLTNKGVTVITN